MSNHTHVVVHVDKDMALAWSVNEVLRRYHMLHNGTLLTQKYVKEETLSPGENVSFSETVEVYRSRLYDISWFMCDLNEFKTHTNRKRLRGMGTARALLNRA